MQNWDESLFAQLEDGSGVDRNLRQEVTNPYVNWYKYNPTQQLHDSLTAEAIQMKSPDMYYVRREFVNIDKILGEDRESKFTKSWKIAAYIDSYANYEGQRDFYSKFGMMSNDEMTLVINPRLFAHQTDGGIPVLGDLIYFPMDNSLFEITWIEFDPFFQFGDRPQRKINLVKFIYTGEELDPTLLPMLIWISNLFEILMGWRIPILNNTKKIKPLKMKVMNSLNRLMLLTGADHRSHSSHKYNQGKPYTCRV